MPGDGVYDVVIVGGGLGGLSLARRLEQRGGHYLLLEARGRLGGRIWSPPGAGHGDGYDLGPAWFWPGQQRMARLVDELGLADFEQYARGRLVYEERVGARRELEFSTMAGSRRLVGGLGRLVAALAGELSPQRVCVNAPVTALRRLAGRVLLLVEGEGEPRRVLAQRVVLALPPRLMPGLSFDPPLAPAAVEAMAAIPTWMAGQAKVVAVYSRPFWRRAGLSGDAISRLGPLAEIHDASPADGGVGALFGFVGLPAAERGDGEALQRAAVEQLARLFGPLAGKPAAVLYRDWANDPWSATSRDRHDPGMGHPDYGMPAVLRGLWEGQLLLAGSELAGEYGGFLEGALVAAEAVLGALPRERTGAAQ